MTIHTALRAYRQSLGLTVTEAAAQAEVSVQTWRKWERADDHRGWSVLRGGRLVPPSTPQGRVHRQFSLTLAAAARIDQVPPGNRSAWLSALIEGAP